MKTQELRKVALPVQGMSCAACAANIESALNARSGIEKAYVNFANHTVYLEYLPQALELADIRDTVRLAGYEIAVSANSAKVQLDPSRTEDLRRRLIFATIFTLPVFVLGMVLGAESWARQWSFVLAIPVVAYSGREFFRNALAQARRLTFNMDTLVAAGAGAAFALSSLNTFFPEFLMQRGLAAHVYFDAACVIITLILLGRLLEENARTKASTAIQALMRMRPVSALVLRDGSEVEIPLDDICVGDEIRIRPGEKIPVDGVVIEGASTLDESAITGESMPVEKTIGDKALSGTLNISGSMLLRAERIGADSMLSRIIAQVERAQGSKAPIQRLVDKISAVFVPVVIGVAVLAFCIWFVWGPEPAFTYAFITSITVLVIACPCALGLATPTAIISGIGRGAQSGILVRDAQSLELAHKATVIALDKTGTLTFGRPSVTDELWTVEPERLKLVQQSIVALERHSEHPVAAAIRRHFACKDGRRPQVLFFQNQAGRGVTGQVDGVWYAIGNAAFMRESDVNIPKKLRDWSAERSAESKTIIYAAENGVAVGCIGIADEIKPTSKRAVSDLRRIGLDIVMLTGDHTQVARNIAREAGIRHVEAELLPQDKAQCIRGLQAEGATVIMVGDGVNDAPALVQADVSIALGGGSDIALETAHITLMKGDLENIVAALRLSRRTVRTIRVNLFWAFAYNAVGIPIAAGALFPVAGILLNPMIAGGAMALSSLSVALNSLRLKKADIDR